MWTKTHSIIVKNIEPFQIWKIWSDLKKRPLWDIDTEWAKLDGPFKQGAIFYMKIKDGPKIKMHITECVVNQTFTDCHKIPFARLYGIHQMEKTENGLRLITTIKVEGLLGWFLKKIIGEKVAAEVPEQTNMLIKLALTQHE